MKQEVIAHTATDKAFLDIRQGIHCTIYLKQLRVVGVEIRAYRGMNATRTLAFLARLMVAAVHAIHISRRASKVAEISFEPRHLRHLLNLAQYALLRAAGDEFALMG